jgi:signal transduction histidine kinase
MSARYWAQTLLPPLVLIALAVASVFEPVRWWLRGQEIYDQEAMQEWVREARVYTTLPDLVRQYLALVDLPETHPIRENEIVYLDRLASKREEIREHLAALGNPPTKIYPLQLPLFPIIYQLAVRFPGHPDLAPIEWDSQLPQQHVQPQALDVDLFTEEKQGVRSLVSIRYHLHAYFQRQHRERQDETRRLLLSGLGLLFAILGLAWLFWAQRRERMREQHRLMAEQAAAAAEKLRLQAEIRQAEAQRKQQEAERQALELGSQLWANIGIMAGSYAHNIKNLLVRPNDLLRRCIEEPADQGQHAHMLREVKDTLGTVTQRLQQILQTVKRDPTKAETTRVDLNALIDDMHRTWADLALDKWKLTLDIEPDRSGDRLVPLWIEGDASNLQQALENLLFNARDATFEMRNYLREQARKEAAVLSEEQRRQALIAAAGWRGRVTLRARRESNAIVLEVADNGIGMSEETRRRCTEAHFSTKRNNALFAGMSAGMGLGLSFVTMILKHHQAELEIESTPQAGTTFRLKFPAAVAV